MSGQQDDMRGLIPREWFPAVEQSLNLVLDPSRPTRHQVQVDTAVYGYIRQQVGQRLRHWPSLDADDLTHRIALKLMVGAANGARLFDPTLGTSFRAWLRTLIDREV